MDKFKATFMRLSSIFFKVIGKKGGREEKFGLVELGSFSLCRHVASLDAPSVP